MIYPWQNQAWSEIAKQSDRLSGSHLFIGQKGLGGDEFLRTLSMALLCEDRQADFMPCQHCPSCQLMRASTHPDFYELRPEVSEEGGKKLQQIKIDQIRDMIESIHLSSLRGGRQVVFIHPAERMNIQAANALLKVLEEPPESVIFLLRAYGRDKVLPTINSRCMKSILPKPSYSEAVAHLKQTSVPDAENLLSFYSGVPLFEFSEDEHEMRQSLIPVLLAPRLLAILDYAASYDKKKISLAWFLSCLQKWLVDLSAVSQGMDCIFYPQYQKELDNLSDQVDEHALFLMMDQLKKIIPYGQHTLNVKSQIESLLIIYLELTL